jgi:hypothetical protein
MLACCGADQHQWEEHEVERRWLPRVLRCFIVGENPGDTDSEYFYQPPASYTLDDVAVRRALLRGLHPRGLILEATLEGFQDAGFLFDHAIRCQLASGVIKVERQRAMRYACRLVENPEHLRNRLADARTVWVMGHFASNAVADASPDFPNQRRQISRPPYPGRLQACSKFFLSVYLSWRTEADAPRFREAFESFAREKAAFEGRITSQSSRP